MVVDHWTRARKLNFLKAGLISRLLITLLSLAFNSPNLWVAIKFSSTPNSLSRSGHITVFKTRDMLLTAFTREFLVRILWKKFSLSLGRLERANSQGGDLKLDWTLEAIRGQLDFWTNWLGLHWASLEAAPSELEEADQPKCFSSRDILEI